MYAPTHARQIGWELTRHAGSGKYDDEWVESTITILKKAKEYDFMIFMDPHQDVVYITGPPIKPEPSINYFLLVVSSFWWLRGTNVDPVCRGPESADL
jgi:hypothetical protein